MYIAYTIAQVAQPPVVERALAPDLARGSMLLLIALANAAGAAFGGTGVEPHPGRWDGALNLVMQTMVHARAYPLFALLFGYSLVQLERRQRIGRATLLRRNAWMAIFGFAHAALLYYGDFLGAYGLIGIAATLVLLPRGDRLALCLWGLALLEVLGLTGLAMYSAAHSRGVSAFVPLTAVESLTAPDYFTSMKARLAEWPRHTASVLPVIAISWLGIYAARRRMLEDIEAHRGLLRRCAVVGLSIAWAGGLPLALVSAKVVVVDQAAVDKFFLLHQASGIFGGPGYAAMAGAAALALRGGRLAGAIAALGSRSLSGYLLQSVAWLIVFAPYLLALGGSMTIALAVAVATWVVLVTAARFMENRGIRGPAEWLLRRLAY